jgi:hypothetical protein
LNRRSHLINTPRAYQLPVQQTKARFHHRPPRAVLN